MHNLEEEEEKKVHHIPNSEKLNHLDLASPNPAREFFDFVFDLLKTGLIVFIIAFILRYFAVQPYVVDGESMMPTFHDKEYLLAEKVSYIFGDPGRGDVVVFKFPNKPSVNYIKRIIGLPGETVSIEDNKISIAKENETIETVVSEKYLPNGGKTLVANSSGVYSKKLNSDEYFVLGDNREHSSDSREWGVLPRSNISGRAWLTLFPMDRIAIHKKVKYDELLSNIQNLYFRFASL